MAVTLAYRKENGCAQDGSKARNGISHISPMQCALQHQKKRHLLAAIVCNCRVIFQSARYPFQGKIITCNLTAEDFCLHLWKYCSDECFKSHCGRRSTFINPCNSFRSQSECIRLMKKKKKRKKKRESASGSAQCSKAGELVLVTGPVTLWLLHPIAEDQYF